MGTVAIKILTQLGLALGQYALNRLSERSTWLGLTGLLTATGVALSPDQAQAIATAGVALAGGIAVGTADQPPSPPPSAPAH